MIFKPLILTTTFSWTKPIEDLIQNNWVSGELFVEFSNDDFVLHNFDFPKQTSLSAQEQHILFKELHKRQALCDTLEDADAVHQILPSGTAQILLTKDTLFLHDATTCAREAATPAQMLTIVLMPAKSAHHHIERAEKLVPLSQTIWTTFASNTPLSHISLDLTQKDFL